MKKATRIIAIILVIIAMSSTMALASEAETPMTEYVRNGITYRVVSATMEESVPAYNEFLLRVAKQIFDEEPLIFGYLIDSRLNSLYGFQITYEDGSKAIYINENISFKQGTQTFFHEMVHYKYDVPGALMYQKSDDNSYFKYGELMEVLTDIIAEREYAKISTNVYKKAYESKIINQLDKEDIEVLIEVYKGNLNLTSEGEIAISLLNKAVTTENLELAKEAVQEIKKAIVEEKGENLSLFSMHIN